MNVAALLKHLSDLSQFLHEAGASASLTKELEEVSGKLSPFREYKLKDFVDFLVVAEDIHRNGLPIPLPKPKPSAKEKKPSVPKIPKLDPEVIESKKRGILELYDRAVDPTVQIGDISQLLEEFEKLQLTKKEIDDLAARLQITQKFKSKAEVLNAIRAKIIKRKGATDRVNA